MQVVRLWGSRGRPAQRRPVVGTGGGFARGLSGQILFVCQSTVLDRHRAPLDVESGEYRA
jgi:hypothetical protein